MKISRFRLAPAVAWRYLTSKKKHGAVSVITWISIIGVAVATAATICVLSVFNGFQQVLSERLELLSPDAEVIPIKGKTFALSDTLMQRVQALAEVEAVCRVVQDRALAVYGGQEMPVRLIGIDTDIFLRHTKLDSLLIAGDATFLPRQEREQQATAYEEFSEEAILSDELGEQQVERVVVSAGVGIRLGIPTQSSEALSIISPHRKGVVNMANPASSLQLQDVDVEGIYQTLQSDFDKDIVFISLHTARELLEVEDPNLTALYVYAAKGVASADLADALRKVMPVELRVRDRLQQHESQFRMSNIEKWITFLLLAFILLIASFNLISSLAMLVIDKQENLGILHALGATRQRIGNIFAWESGYVTLLGGTIGILLGVALSLLQQHYGLIHLNGDPGTLIVEAYPSQLDWHDLIAVSIPLTVIGVLTAFLTSRFARSRTEA